ncbi:MAG: hypothetical protein FJ125_17200, partial [Deltaproteobacteria bacterium]|nr:hypothetical protein [Deltaproteobacteria bacterium]
VPRPWRRGLTAWLERRLAGADGRGQLPDGERASTQAYREALPGLHQEWLRQASDPAVAPRAGWVNGVAPLAWRARLPVADGQQLGDALDSLEQLSREEDQPVWIWCLPDSEGSGFAEVQGILRLERSQLVIDAAAEEQARQAAAFVEATAGQALGGPAVLRRVPPASLQQAAGSRLLPEEPLALPVSRPLLQRPEVKQALVSFFERWYRRWIELPLPLLGGASPQAAAAGSPANRGRLKGLLGDLAHGYEQSLRQMEPAFDPSWLWRELGQGLAEDVDSPDRRPSRPPVLGHEAIRRFVPGIGEAAARIAARRRSRSDFTRDTVLTRDELGDDPDFDSFLAAHGKLMHRFMVRGHWRRPAASWKEQRPRWIEPYWKGPDMAAIVEREYRLKP